MSKISDYELRRLGQQASDFKDDVLDILNNGKMQFPVVVGTPTTSANMGELILSSSGTIFILYARMNSAWVIMARGSP